MIARLEMWLLAAALTLVFCGCSAELDSYYGRHRVPQGSESVNGTDVLAAMFTKAGHKIYYRRTLVTSEMEDADTIVWTPNDFAAPRAEACEWFEQWLYEAPGRTLVYVGRDFDAAPLYWKHMKPRVGKDQQRAYELRELDAKINARGPKDMESRALECKWFRFKVEPVKDVEALDGPWAKGIAAKKTEMKLQTKLVPLRGKRLLTSNGDPLVSQYSKRVWEGSSILLVANGSFLLNLPLVNHEHRKLAGKVVEATGEPGHVVFLESGPGGPVIDPPYADDSLWTLFGAWPLNAILLQLAVAGVIFCFARWPIFGRPRQPSAETTSDFGRHVDAVGQLLARTKDRQFALERVSQAEQARGEAAQAPTPKRIRRGRNIASSPLPPEAKGH